MIRTLSVAAALLTSTLVLGATASHAQSGYYTATPAATPTKTSFVARETVWTWRDTAYTARKGDSRDAIQCELAAKQAGKLTAFTAGGTAFDAAALDKCNAKAK